MMYEPIKPGHDDILNSSAENGAFENGDPDLPEQSPKDWPSFVAWFREHYSLEEAEKDFRDLPEDGETLEEAIANIKKSLAAGD